MNFIFMKNIENLFYPKNNNNQSNKIEIFKISKIQIYLNNQTKKIHKNQKSLLFKIKNNRIVQFNKKILQISKKKKKVMFEEVTKDQVFILKNLII